MKKAGPSTLPDDSPQPSTSKQNPIQLTTLGKRKSNKFVSTSLVSRADRELINDLTVKPKVPSVHGNSKSVCWKYIGHLHSISRNILLDGERYYCQPCLSNAKETSGHISSVKSFSHCTSTGTMALHLSMKHSIHEVTENKVGKIIDYIKKYDASSPFPAPLPATSHELHRDFAIWFCRDLLPFETVAKEGMTDFFRKVIPGVQLPSPTTVANMALNDVYMAVHAEVQELLKDVKSLCLMFDGWTDKHKGRPYLGLRASFIKNWSYTVVTLSCHVLAGHTAREIADHVLKVLSEFVPDVKRVLLSSCHDGAANMIKSSQLLKVENFQHCTAHAIHLLLTVDSLYTEQEVVALLQKCRNIVSALHFKSVQVEDEIAGTQDKVVIESLKDKMSNVSQLLDMDDQYPLTTDADADQSDPCHIHTSLKMSCPTRWNSSLTMAESILDLKREAMNALKRIGKLDLCLDTDEVDQLCELKNFLKPFESFTDLVSTPTPTLSLIPLMKLQIRKLCKPNDSDSTVMQSLKSKVLNKLDVRLPESKAVRIQQLLDPSTKDMMPREQAIHLLQETVRSLIKMGLITVQLPVEQGTDVENPVCKRQMLKQEMLNEARQLTPASDEDLDGITMEITNYLSTRCVGNNVSLLNFAFSV